MNGMFIMLNRILPLASLPLAFRFLRSSRFPFRRERDGGVMSRWVQLFWAFVPPSWVWRGHSR